MVGTPVLGAGLEEWPNKPPLEREMALKIAEAIKINVEKQ